MAAESAPPEPLVKLADMPGRGRALLASRHIKPGEIILSESPILLYPAVAPASDYLSPTSTLFCSHCFRTIRAEPVTSAFLPSAEFCSTRCLSARSVLHPYLSRSFTVLPFISNTEVCAQVYFLLAAFVLSSTSPAKFQQLLSLNGGDAKPTQEEAVFLHTLTCPLTGFSIEVTAALIAKDKRNAFGLMEPPREGDAGERRVRVYGIYPNASFFNHDCLPNACRFDYLDRDGEGNTDIVVRAIHDIPEGREVCLSYFPTNWRYKERQQRLRDDYGFHCNCDRCEVEKNWKEDEDDEDMEEDETVRRMEEESFEGSQDGNIDFPHAYFFIRYACEQENCGGTMAPLPPLPQDTPSELLECNVCGRIRKDEGFGGDCDGGDGIMLDV